MYTEVLTCDQCKMQRPKNENDREMQTVDGAPYIKVVEHKYQAEQLHFCKWECLTLYAMARAKWPKGAPHE